MSDTSQPAVTNSPRLYLISGRLLGATLNYLNRQPYGVVKPLMDELTMLQPLDMKGDQPKEEADNEG